MNLVQFGSVQKKCGSVRVIQLFTTYVIANITVTVDDRTFILLYKALVRRSACRICKFCLSPDKKGDIEAIEKIQKRATKLVISLRKLPYKERLQPLNLYTLKYRKLRGDMIEVFKILHPMYVVR